jgi:glycosyltransferase involved in cell wall biosynthesis
MKLSVIIPCYNESGTIRQVVNAVKNSPWKDLEIIIVDDCSTDGTREILKGETEQQVDRVIYHEFNQGKGKALRNGIREATGEGVIVQDADLEYDPNEYPQIIEPILQDRADVVYGSRFLGGGAHRVLYFWHRVGNGLLTLLSNMLTNLNMTDMETCYKAFRREVIQSITLEEDRFDSSLRLQRRSPRQVAGSMRWGSPIMGGPTRRGKRSIGRMDSGQSGVF